MQSLREGPGTQAEEGGGHGRPTAKSTFYPELPSAQARAHPSWLLILDQRCEETCPKSHHKPVTDHIQATGLLIKYIIYHIDM